VVLSPSWLCAQAAELTVNVPSTIVYKAPSTGSIVIGEAGRGTVLAVTREVGDWVKIAWPADKDGIGYVRLSAGTLSGHPAPAASAPAPATPAVPSSTVDTAAQAQRTVPGVGSHRTEYVTAPEHVVGVGGLIGGVRLGFGITGRAWLQKRIGVQMDASRYSSTDAAAPNRLTSTRLAPAVLYALPDRVSDYVWLRPYVGAGMTFRQQTLKDAGTNGVEIASERKSGLRVLGGGEMTFSSMPSLALSAEVGYEWPRAPFAGVDAGGPVFSISARWYVK
jgi:opacity protein-like surface antigen